MKKIEENDKALMFESLYGDYEVWMKLIGKYGKFKGLALVPTDEDFGVWAWSCYNLASARKIYDEITSGVRNISPMTEIN